MRQQKNKLMGRKQLTHLAAAFLVTLPLLSAPAAAQPNVHSNTPTGFAMIGDALVARPLMLATTVLGTGLFVVTLPFTLLGGNVGEAAEVMVVTPAASTFVRCLGCTPVQNEHVELERKTQRADEAATKD